MNRAIQTTLVMGVIAVVTAGIAAAIYPWPEAVSINELKGEKLFADFDARKVRAIKVVKIDADRSLIQRIRVERDKTLWTIPVSSNYPAGNTRRIASITDALGEREILNVTSEDQESHLKYGVLDPEAPTSNDRLSGIGQKVTASDINGRPLASLIIGLPLRNDPTQRYVRVANQPTVYEIKFNDAMLSTEVSDWVDTNLLGLAVRSGDGGRIVRNIMIENYIINEKTLATGGAKSTNYHALIKLDEKGLTIEKLWLEKDGKLTESTDKPKLKQEAMAALTGNLTFFLFSAAIRKPDEVAKLIESASFVTNKSDATANDFKSTLPMGFRWSKFEDGDNNFDCANGKVIVNTTDGLRFVVQIGSIVKGQEATGDTLKNFMMVNAGVDPLQVPMPEKPADANDKQKRDYDRAVKTRELKIEEVQALADEFNQRMAGWYFLINENIVNAIQPDIDTMTK